MESSEIPCCHLLVYLRFFVVQCAEETSSHRRRPVRVEGHVWSEIRVRIKGIECSSNRAFVANNYRVKYHCVHSGPPKTVAYYGKGETASPKRTVTLPAGEEPVTSYMDVLMVEFKNPLSPKQREVEKAITSLPI